VALGEVVAACMPSQWQVRGWWLSPCTHHRAQAWGPVVVECVGAPGEAEAATRALVAALPRYFEGAEAKRPCETWGPLVTVGLVPPGEGVAHG
jgi:hypothetical protein